MLFNDLALILCNEFPLWKQKNLKFEEFNVMYYTFRKKSGWSKSETISSWICITYGYRSHFHHMYYCKCLMCSYLHSTPLVYVCMLCSWSLPFVRFSNWVWTLQITPLGIRIHACWTSTSLCKEWCAKHYLDDHEYIVYTWNKSFAICLKGLRVSMLCYELRNRNYVIISLFLNLLLKV